MPPILSLGQSTPQALLPVRPTIELPYHDSRRRAFPIQTVRQRAKLISRKRGPQFGFVRGERRRSELPEESEYDLNLLRILRFVIASSHFDLSDSVAIYAFLRYSDGVLANRSNGVINWNCIVITNGYFGSWSNARRSGHAAGTSSRTM